MPSEQTAIHVRVRYVECDAQGMAHHSAFPVWMEMARTEWLRELGMSYREMEQQGVYFVVAKLSIRYRTPARYDDQLQVRVVVEALGGSLVEQRYEIIRDGQRIADAATTLVCVDAQGKPRRMPAVISRARD